MGAISDSYRLRSRISPEWIHISTIGKVVDQLRPLPRRVKKDGELWYTNEKVIGAHVDPLKLHFSTDFISASRGCWPLKFLHTLEIDQRILAHPRAALRWALPHISSFYLFRHAISELPRPIAAKLCHMIAIWVRFIMQVQKLGGPSPQRNWGPKTCKIRRGFR